MNYILTAIVFVLIFSVLILVHELGHFLMAKRAGIKVLEFGFGLPPKIWSKKKGETIYSINLIPFGGFVRMLGESDVNNRLAKNKRSYVAQSLRNRMKVVTAGVLMNFILAWVLFTVGYSFGMEPLIMPDQFLSAVNNGVVDLEEGVLIESVEENSGASRVGFLADDLMIDYNGKTITMESVQRIADGDPYGSYRILRDGRIYSYEVTKDFFDSATEKVFGLEFGEAAAVPRVKIFEINELSNAYKAGLREGDIVLRMNGQEIFAVQDFENIFRAQEGILEYEIYRNSEVQKIVVEALPMRKVIVAKVLSETPAEIAGLQEGDVIVNVNGVNFYESLKLIEFVNAHAEERLAYTVLRDGLLFYYEIIPEEGKIGVLLSELVDYGENQDISVYNAELVSSIIKIEKEQYPVYKAVYKSLSEGARLSYVTAGAFKDFVVNLFHTGSVSDDVSGPVGIAQMTYIFVQEGTIPVLRFMAILSLSLAVINILPLPALDGGRFLFLIIELIIGRRINQKWESYIHVLGYGLILLLIFTITYSDILKIIA